MGVIIVLMAGSLLIASVFLIAFIWAFKSNQYDDTFTPSIRALHDDKD